MRLSLFRQKLPEALKKDKYLLLIDQALLSLVNFGSVIFLAKTVSVETFAAFVILYSYYLFTFLVSTCYISTPILVFLRKKWLHKEGEYLCSALILHSVLCLGLVSLCYVFLSRQVQGISFLYFFLMAFSISAFDLLKKFIFSSKNIAIKYGLIATSVLNILFFYGLFGMPIQDVSDILMLFWVTFMVANTILLVFIFKKGVFKNTLHLLSKENVLFFREVSKTHFHYAKWILIGGVAFWGYTQGVYILGKAFGISDFTIGKTRTIQSLLGVFNVLAISIESHYTPIFSESLKLYNRKKIVYALSAVYAENYKKIIILFIASIPIGIGFYHIMYAEKYGNGLLLFLLFLCIQFIFIGIKPVSSALKAIEKTRALFSAQLLAFVCMTIPFLTLIYLAVETNAIAISTAIASVIYGLFLWLYLKRKIV